MAKPSVLPLWNTAEERVLAPTATQRATGWVWTGSKFEKPKGETLNYWMNNVGKWVKYFDEEVVPTSPIASPEEYTALGGESSILTDDNTNIQLYKNDVFLEEGTDYTLNVDGVTVDLVVPLTVNDFMQWYDLKKLNNSFYTKFEAGNSFIEKDINSLAAKTTPVDADELILGDSSTSFSLKKLTWSNLKTAYDATFLENDTRVKTALNASGAAPIYACRAWVNFNGTGTIAIRASGNVSSIIDNGTGDYTVNFITPMQDANYSSLATAEDLNGGDSPISTQKYTTKTTSSVSFKFWDYTGVPVDVLTANITITR